jgi:ComF family protein
MVRGARVLRLPSLCEVCGDWQGPQGRAALCGACMVSFAAALPRCTRCGLRCGTPVQACGACLQTPPRWRHAYCAVEYGFPWDQLIGRLKFQGQPELAAPLSALMLRVAPPPGAVSALLPVPLSQTRLAERGYNQAWELTRQLGAACALPARADVLWRPLASAASQTALGRRERLQRLRGAFMVNPAARSWLQGRAVALVDDVLTTGATAQAAACALLQAGATAVDVWVLARTPAVAD